MPRFVFSYLAWLSPSDFDRAERCEDTVEATTAADAVTLWEFNGPKIDRQLPSHRGMPHPLKHNIRDVYMRTWQRCPIWHASKTGVVVGDWQCVLEAGHSVDVPHKFDD